MAQLYPQIRDKSTLTGVFGRDTFMTIGIEGRKDTGGTGNVGQPYVIAQGGDADTLFGASSSLAGLVKFVLAKGVSHIVAVASKSNAAPVLADRQAAWTALEEDPTVRIRLTDDNVQATLVALADSCEWADGIYNKQFAVGGLATTTTAGTLISAVTAISSKRFVLVGPGLYDDQGNLLGGPFSAAWIACRIALNPNIADDLDLTLLPGSAGIEKDTNGMPLFRLKAGAGSPVNDFELLLQGGVSPLRQDESGAAQITHLRMAYITDTTYDALETLLIKDQLFLDIRDLLNSEQFLRRGNNLVNQAFAASLVSNYLDSRSTGANSWIQKIIQGDGTLGWNITPVVTADGRNLTIHAQAQIVRNLQTIDINNVLSIAA